MFQRFRIDAGLEQIDLIGDIPPRYLFLTVQYFIPTKWNFVSITLEQIFHIA